MSPFSYARREQLAERGLIIKRPAGEFHTPVKAVHAGAIEGCYDIALLARLTT
jgi:hypothetical protein